MTLSTAVPIDDDLEDEADLPFAVDDVESDSQRKTRYILKIYLCNLSLLYNAILWQSGLKEDEADLPFAVDDVERDSQRKTR